MGIGIYCCLSFILLLILSRGLSKVKSLSCLKQTSPMALFPKWFISEVEQKPQEKEDMISRTGWRIKIIESLSSDDPFYSLVTHRDVARLIDVK